MNRRVRHIAAIAALLSIVLSAHGGLVTRLLFEIRHDYIASNHCENRFNPEVKCDGLCFLKKRMADHHEHDHEQKAPQIGSPVLYFLTSSASTLVPPREEHQSVPPAQERVPLEAAAGTIDHPPRLV